MKRILLILCSVLLTTFAYSQVKYSNITEVDRFDDIIYSKQIKTIFNIEHTDSFSYVTIETKGFEPSKYIVLSAEFNGDKDNPVELVGGVFGYEVRLTALSDIYEAYKNKRKSTQVEIVIRTTVTQYRHAYLDDMVWIKYDDGSRIIYRH